MQSKSRLGIHLLSVIIPAYKQEKTIKKDIKKIQKTLEALGYNYEIIVVVDGIIDKTYEHASKLKNARIKIIAYPKNQGKGQAIRYGMMCAKGDIIGFIDAGMDIDPNGFAMLLSHMEWYKADIIVGSKLHPVSRVDYPLSRTIISWGYRNVTKLLFGFKIRDTQVGMKFFKKKVIKDVLPRLLVKAYAFDIEILAVAYSRGYHRIYEAPVKIKFNSTSIVSKRLWQTILLMFWDTLAVFYRLKIVHYYQNKSRKTRHTKETITIKLQYNK